MKKSKIQLTNPNPYKLNIVIRNLNLSITIENPDGLNHQNIYIKYRRRKTKEYDLSNEKYELTKPELQYIEYYLKEEGYLEEARQHNLYFDDEK